MFIIGVSIGVIIAVAQLALAWALAGGFLRHIGAYKHRDRRTLATFLAISWYWAEVMGALLAHAHLF